MENREIKFRVWNGSKMEHNVMAGFLGAFYVQGIDEKDSASMSSFNTKYFVGTPLMQFTGLKDKNGVEIYEGDIVTDNATTFEIKWYKGRFDLYRIKGCYQNPYIGDNCARMEIIGNIYQNPQLTT